MSAADDVLRTSTAIAQLDAIDEPILRTVLDIHSRHRSGDAFYCNGCDQGCRCEPAEWPCTTVIELSAKLGIDLSPDHAHAWAFKAALS